MKCLNELKNATVPLPRTQSMVGPLPSPPNSLLRSAALEPTGKRGTGAFEKAPCRFLFKRRSRREALKSGENLSGILSTPKTHMHKYMRVLGDARGSGPSRSGTPTSSRSGRRTCRRRRPRWRPAAPGRPVEGGGAVGRAGTERGNGGRGGGIRREGNPNRHKGSRVSTRIGTCMCERSQRMGAAVAALTHRNHHAEGSGRQHSIMGTNHPSKGQGGGALNGWMQPPLRKVQEFRPRRGFLRFETWGRRGGRS